MDIYRKSFLGLSILFSPFYLLSADLNRDSISYYLISKKCEKRDKKQHYIGPVLTLVIYNHSDRDFQIDNFCPGIENINSISEGNNYFYWDMICLNDSTPGYCIITGESSARWKSFHNLPRKRLTIKAHSYITEDIYLYASSMYFLRDYYKILLYTAHDKKKVWELVSPG